MFDDSYTGCKKPGNMEESAPNAKQPRLQFYERMLAQVEECIAIFPKYIKAKDVTYQEE
jgi:hypothetical protein